MESTRDFGRFGEDILFNQALKEQQEVRKFLIQKMNGATPEIQDWLMKMSNKERGRISP